MRVTGTLGVFLTETQSHIEARKKGLSWRDLGAVLQVPHGALYHVYTGQLAHISRQQFLQVRAALGLPPPVVKPAHRPYITDDQEWQDFQTWRANRRKTQKEQP